MYYEYNENVRSIVSHRILALNRGEKEEILKVSIEAPVERIYEYLQKDLISKTVNEDSKNILLAAVEDSYKRLIQPSIEREIRNQLTEKAENQAIAVFSTNLKKSLTSTSTKRKNCSWC